MIANLAQELNDEETLRELYLLTVADMSMVAPGNMTEWKEQLLRELYVRTMAFYRRGADSAGADEQAALVGAAQEARRPSCSASRRTALADWFASLARSLRGADAAARDRARPAAVAAAQGAGRRRGRAPPAQGGQRRHRLRRRRARPAVEDRRRAASPIASTSSARRSTRASSTARVVEALDTFTTRDRYGRPITDAGALAARRGRPGARARRRGHRRAGDRGAAREVVAARARRAARCAPRSRSTTTSRPTSASSTSTRRIGSASSTPSRARSPSCALDIHLSKVATEAQRVADVFYVRERGGGKLDARPRRRGASWRWPRRSAACRRARPPTDAAQLRPSPRAASTAARAVADALLRRVRPGEHRLPRLARAAARRSVRGAVPARVAPVAHAVRRCSAAPACSRASTTPAAACATRRRCASTSSPASPTSSSAASCRRGRAERQRSSSRSAPSSPAAARRRSTPRQLVRALRYERSREVQARPARLADAQRAHQSTRVRAAASPRGWCRCSRS